MPNLEAVNTSLNTNKFNTTKPPKSFSGISGNLNPASQSIMNAMYAIGYSLSDSENVGKVQASVERAIKRRYLAYMRNMALANPRAFWHAYEPNKIGLTSARLFDIKASEKQYKSSMPMQLFYRPSVMMTPVPPPLNSPGPSGKYVKRRHKFPNKAIVHEYGQTVTIRPIKSDVLVMTFDRKTVRFVSKPIIINTKKRETFGQITASTITFFQTAAIPTAIPSYKRYAKEAAEAGRRAAKRNVYVKVPSDKMAKTIGKQFAKRVVVK